MATTARPMTVDEFLANEAEWDRIEVFDGVPREDEGVGARHGEVSDEFGRFVGNHVADRRLGRTYSSDTRYVLQTDPLRIVAPDVSFVRADRLPPKRDRERPFLIAPDLAVEIMSPGNTGPEMERRVQYYLDAGVPGVPLVFVADFRRETITAHSPGRSPRTYGIDDVLDGGDVLPDLRIRVADIFR